MKTNIFVSSEISSGVMKNIKMFGYNERRYVWRKQEEFSFFFVL